MPDASSDVLGMQVQAPTPHGDAATSAHEEPEAAVKDAAVISI